MRNNIKMLCTFPNCIKTGGWKPVIEVKIPENDRAFLLDFNISLCYNHMKQTNLNDIIGGSVFKSIVGLFKQKFIYPPKKENCVLKWERTNIPIFTHDGKFLGNTPIKGK